MEKKKINDEKVWLIDCTFVDSCVKCMEEIPRNRRLDLKKIVRKLSPVEEFENSRIYESRHQRPIRRDLSPDFSR